MRCWRFGWFAVVGLLAGLLTVSARQAKAQGGPGETLAVPSLQALGKVPDLDEALKAFRAGDLGGALQSLRAAAKKNPDLPPAQTIFAAWLVEVNQMAMARNALEQVALEAPDDPEAYVMLADLAARERQVTEATLLLGKANEILSAGKISPKRTAAVKRRVLAGLATLALADSRRDWKQAQTYLEAMLADEPKNPAALEQLARALFYQKKPEEALTRLQEAGKLDPTLLAPEATLAQLYQQSGDPQGAGKWMLSAIKANPKDPRVRRVAAQWSLEIGRPDQAEDQAKAAVQLEPDSVASHIVRGMVAVVRKDYKTAEESFGKAHLLSPGNFAALSDMALVLAEQDDAAKKRLALEFAQVLIRLFPEQPDAASTLGWTLYRLGRLDEADASLRKAVSAGTSSPETYYFYARVLADRGRKEDAKKFLEAAFKAAKPPAPFLWRAEAEALGEQLKK